MQFKKRSNSTITTTSQNGATQTGRTTQKTRRKWQKEGKIDVNPQLKTLQWLPSIVEIKPKLPITVFKTLHSLHITLTPNLCSLTMPASLLFLEHITVDPWPMQGSEALTLCAPLTPCAVENPHINFWLHQNLTVNSLLLTWSLMITWRVNWHVFCMLCVSHDEFLQ